MSSSSPDLIVEVKIHQLNVPSGHQPKSPAFQFTCQLVMVIPRSEVQANALWTGIESKHHPVTKQASGSSDENATFS